MKKQKKFTICCVSRLVRIKEIEYLFEAINHLDINVILIGGGEKEYVQELRKKAPNNITFLGYIIHEEMSHYYNYADIFVAKQPFEGWGRTLLEAMSCGKPIIAASSPRAYKELPFKGWPIQPGDVEGLRNAIIEASKTPKETLKQMGKANREIILKKFSWDITYEKILTIIKRCC